MKRSNFINIFYAGTTENEEKMYCRKLYKYCTISDFITRAKMCELLNKVPRHLIRKQKKKA